MKELDNESIGSTSSRCTSVLGTSLKLPSWLEAHREEIVQALPSLESALEVSHD
jgi:hypothetical protein